MADKTVLVETRGERKRRNLLPAFGVAAMNAIELSNIASCANPQGTSRGLFRQSRYGTIRTGNDRALALPG